MNITHQSVKVVLSSLIFTLYMSLVPKPFRKPSSCLIKSEIDVGTVYLSGAGELVTHLASVYSHLTIHYSLIPG